MYLTENSVQHCWHIGIDLLGLCTKQVSEDMHVRVKKEVNWLQELSILQYKKGLITGRNLNTRSIDRDQIHTLLYNHLYWFWEAPHLSSVVLELGNESPSPWESATHVRGLLTSCESSSAHPLPRPLMTCQLMRWFWEERVWQVF